MTEAMKNMIAQQRAEFKKRRKERINQLLEVAVQAARMKQNKMQVA